MCRACSGLGMTTLIYRSDAGYYKTQVTHTLTCSSPGNNHLHIALVAMLSPSSYVSGMVYYALRYSAMLQSWKASPEERPCFSELVETISGQLESLAGYLHISTFTELENNF